jgi:hypothetical protein
MTIEYVEDAPNRLGVGKHERHQVGYRRKMQRPLSTILLLCKSGARNRHEDIKEKRSFRSRSFRCEGITHPSPDHSKYPSEEMQRFY